jgi:hypothetical protein
VQLLLGVVYADHWERATMVKGKGKGKGKGTGKGKGKGKGKSGRGGALGGGSNYKGFSF